ncbi:MAG TPA: molybdenum cofactor guanylyltransferase [Opitutaceae bacterium]|nr:molybdenum cofactor guanylyltransferase [Opitutaceae bacterium]
MLGVILAGGDSRRMGHDKADLRWRNRPLWQRQRDILRFAGATPVVMVRRPDQPAPDGIECWRDTFVQAGPLAGLQTALAHNTAPWVAVLAVDMPGIGADWFWRLRARCSPGVGAMIRHAAACEPLAAIYPAEALAEIEARLRRQEYSLQSLALALAAQRRMHLVTATPAECVQARSVNTPREWSHHRAPARPLAAAFAS